MRERKKSPSKRQSVGKSAEDIAQAKAKAALMREEGMKQYKEQLLKELEADRRRKVRVVLFLYLMSLCIALAFYFSNTDFAEIEQMIVKAMQAAETDETDID